MSEEITYLDNPSAKITSSRVIIAGTTYALSNITSVSMAIIPANGTLGLIILLVGLVIGVCSGFGAQGNFTGGALVGIVIGVVLFLAGGALAFRAKTSYAVRIGSASGESNALASPDKAQIQAIVNAMNEAIVKRG